MILGFERFCHPDRIPLPWQESVSPTFGVYHLIDLHTPQTFDLSRIQQDIASPQLD